jgi:crotonobetainyl-CoA:carnitine CoA-transferase CaiB-like acyl-CoA transferase
LLEEADIPVAPLNTLESLMQDVHLKEVGFFTTSEHPSEGLVRGLGQPWSWSDSQPSATRPAPRIGQHSVEILHDIGYDEQQIRALIEGRSTLDGSTVS